MFASTSSSVAALLAAAAFMALPGCRATGPTEADAPVSASAAATASPAAMTLPPTSVGQWIDLGAYSAPWLAGDAPVPVNGAAAGTRVAGLRHADGRWLAIVILQSAPQEQAPCPQPDVLHLNSRAADSCLRMRRNADFDRWMQQQHSVLYHWVQAQGWDMQPRAWVAYRTPSGGGTTEAHALLHPSLIEPVTHSHHDFLNGGQPGDAWAQRFAQAARSAAGGSPLAVPPFPFAPPAYLPAAPVSAASAEPAPSTPQAEQVPAPARPASPPPPRPDRQ